jgi:ABC-type transport system involved in multi-copper enzyme maturation permease subunit
VTATTTAPPTGKPVANGFRSVLWAEWTKFRTVRGWVIAAGAAAVLCVASTFLVTDGKHEGGCTGPPAPGSGPNSPGTGCYTGHPFVPTGPNGEAIADSYEFVDRPLTGNGTITARVTALTGIVWSGPANQAPSLAHTEPGLAAWAKAGLLLTPSTVQGSPYAAVMATGSHGARFQYNYTHDRAGPPGAVTTSSTRWLRLTRAGGTITGDQSADGRDWSFLGTAHLAGLPATVDVGLFVTSPVVFDSTGGTASRATATFDHVTFNGATVSGGWQAQSIGTGPGDYYQTLGAGSYHRTGATFALAGSGDIAPAVALAGGDTAASSLWFGLIVALIVLIVVAAMYITAEYRRGLIRTTFTAIPDRASVLAAKSVVAGAVAFTAGAAAAAVSLPLGEHILNANGNYVFPTSGLTEVRVIAGSGALAAFTAITAVALGTVLRRSAGAVTAGIALIVLPYIVGSLLSGAAQTWLFRLTPAAGFSVLAALPRSGLVSYPYTFANGYYPLAAWAGLAVLCAYAVAALGTATVVVRRRDA